jgi:hypothetical protein
MFEKTQTTGPNAGLRVSPNSDGRVVSQEWLRDGAATPRPIDGLLTRPNTDGRVASEDWYKDGAPTPRPGGVKAAAAAAAAKQAQPEVIAKTGPKKARDDDQR